MPFEKLPTHTPEEGREEAEEEKIEEEVEKEEEGEIKKEEIKPGEVEEKVEETVPEEISEEKIEGKPPEEEKLEEERVEETKPKEVELEKKEAEKELKEKINREAVLNYLDSNLRRKKKLPLIEFQFTVDSYELLGEEVPDRDRIVGYLNSLQTKEGTWNTGKKHYVPTTAQILMAYDRWGLEPPHSVEPFFRSVDTWEKARAHVKKYTPDNYWGGLWGYIACYTVQEKTPPWKDEFLRELEERFDEWSTENHQRTHVIASLLQLNEDIPHVNRLAEIAISQQKNDGRWEDRHWNMPVPQTSFGIFALETLRNKTNIPVDESIAKATRFIAQCYKRKREDQKEIAGFTMGPEHEKLDSRATAMGIGVSRPEAFSEFLNPRRKH